MKQREKKKKNIVLRVIVGILIFVLFLVLVVCVTFGILYYKGKNNLLTKEAGPVVLETAPETEPETTAAPEEDPLEEGEISYNGNRYRYKDSLVNILCMGVDKKSLESGEKVYGKAGQADFIVLVSVDTDTGKITMTNISRETMTDINLYSQSGRYVGTEERQICLAYAYGDGAHASCENVELAVSRLMYGIPIQAYAAVSISAIPVINDAVGGVKVTLTEEAAVVLTDRCDGTYKAGDRVTLDGDQAYEFIHYRNWKGEDAPVDSNNARMARQRQYITAFAGSVMEKTLSDPTIPVQLFDIVTDYTVTDLTVSDISYLSSVALQNGISRINMETVPGEVSLGEDGYAQYRVDEEKLFQMVLTNFYEPKQVDSNEQ